MGEDELQSRRRFFQIMMPGFEERLKLPPAFCEEVKHEKSKRAILESCKGRWKINVCRDDDDQILFKDGWPGFVEDHGLSLKDFLVFEHTAKLHFNVMVYDVSGCLKQFPIHSNPTYAVGKSEELTFGVKITRLIASKKGVVNIPNEFVKSNNLTERRGAVLKDPQRRSWRVRLYVENWPCFRRVMTKGWRDFVVSNEVKEGDFCTFELIPTNSTILLFHVDISRTNEKI